MVSGMEGHNQEAVSVSEASYRSETMWVVYQFQSRRIQPPASPEFDAIKDIIRGYLNCLCHRQAKEHVLTLQLPDVFGSADSYSETSILYEG